MRRSLWIVWLASLFGPTLAAAWGADPPAATQEIVGIRPSSALQNGIDFHLAGEIEAAEPFLRHAEAHRQHLSADERSRLEDYLNRNQQALQGRREAQELLRRAHVALQSAALADAESALASLRSSKYVTAAERQQVNALGQRLHAAKRQATETARAPARSVALGPDQLLGQAREAFEQSDLDAAEALARHALAAGFWTPFPWGDTPGKVLRDVRAARVLNAAPAATARPPSPPDEVVAVSTVQAPNGKSAEVTIVKTRPDGGAHTFPLGAGDTKNAVKLARLFLDEGKIDEAEDLARRARLNVDVKYGLFEDSPEKILRDAGKVRDESNRQRAGILLAAARRCLSEGRYDEAERLAYQSEALRFDYPIWHRGDTPERIVAAVEARRRQGVRVEPPPMAPVIEREKNDALANGATAPQRGYKPADLPPLLDAAPPPAAAKDSAAATKSSSPPTSVADGSGATIQPPGPPAPPDHVDQRTQALALLAQARLHARQDEYLKALNLTGKAKAMAWSPQDGDDTPDAVLADLAAARQKTLAPPAANGPEDARRLAALYLVEARIRQKEGRLLDALHATRLASQCGASFTNEEESPSAVYQDLQEDCRAQLETYAAAARALADYGRRLQEADQPLASYERYYADAQRYARYVLQLAEAYQVDGGEPPIQLDAVRQAAALGSPEAVGGVQTAEARQEADEVRRVVLQAEAHLRLGRFAEARRLAERLYAQVGEARAEASALLRNVDEREHAAEREKAETSYREGVQAFARKDFAGAATHLGGLDVRLLDEAKRARVLELLARPEVKQWQADRASGP